MKSFILCLIVGYISCLPSALAQDGPQYDPYLAHLEEMRQVFGFATWPGKNGDLKKGLAFNVPEYPMLSGYAILSEEERLELYNLEYGLIRSMALKGNGGILRIEIAVAHTSTDNAHELLLRMGLPRSSLPSPWKRGDTDGLAVGDLNIISSGRTGASPGGYIAFVRHNVVCVLYIQGAEELPGLDLKAFAEQLDGKIRALPNLTAAEFEASRPTITTFGPAKPSIKLIGDATDDESTVLNVVAADPAHEPLRTVFEDYGKLRIDGTVVPPVAGPGGTAGAFPLKLIVINQSLQYKEATTTVAVVDATAGE